MLQSIIIRLLKKYFNKKVRLTSYNIIDVTTNIISKIIFLIIFFLLYICILFLSSIGLAFLIGNYLNNIWKGFIYVAILYLILIIIIFIIRKKIKKFIVNKTIRSINKINKNNDEY